MQYFNVKSYLIYEILILEENTFEFIAAKAAELEFPSSVLQELYLLICYTLFDNTQGGSGELVIRILIQYWYNV